MVSVGPVQAAPAPGVPALQTLFDEGQVAGLPVHATLVYCVQWVVLQSESCLHAVLLDAPAVQWPLLGQVALLEPVQLVPVEFEQTLLQEPVPVVAVQSAPDEEQVPWHADSAVPAVQAVPV